MDNRGATICAEGSTLIGSAGIFGGCALSIPVPAAETGGLSRLIPMTLTPHYAWCREREQKTETSLPLAPYDLVRRPYNSS